MAETKGGLAFIPETSSEAIQANKAYQEALNRLNSALEARQNKMFDPTMLALAEGFLTPGRTGSFGEALGTAAGKMRAAEEVESKQEQELAQAKLGLAQQQMQLARQKQMSDVARAHFFGQGASQPSGGAAAPSVSGSAPATSGAPRGVIDPAAAYIALAYARGEDPDKIEQTAIKIRIDASKVVEGGVFNPLTGKFDPFGIKDVPVDVGGQSYKVPVSISMQYNDLIKQGNYQEAVKFIKNYIEITGTPSASLLAGATARAQEEARLSLSPKMTARQFRGEEYPLPEPLAVLFDQMAAKFGRDSPQAFAVISSYLQFGRGAEGAPAAAPPAAAAPSAAAPTGAPPTAAPPAPAGAPPAPAVTAPGAAPPVLGVLSQRQIEERNLASKLDVEGLAKWNNDKRAEILGRSSEAQEDMRIARQLELLAGKKYANQIFGMLSDPSVAAAFAKLAESSAGITLPGGARATIGIPNLEQILVNLSIPKEAQPDARVALQLMRQLQLRQSSLMKGAPSNFEQGLAAEANINPSDTPETVVRKAQMVVARGQFDRDVAEFMRKTNITPYRLPDTDWYKNRLLQLDQTLFDLQKGGKLVPVSSVPRPSGVESDWTLKMDAKGNKAWVSPDGKKAVEVK